MLVKVALVDDNMVNRNTFIRKIQTFDDLEVVFTAPNGSSCLEHLKALPKEKNHKYCLLTLKCPT